LHCGRRSLLRTSAASYSHLAAHHLWHRRMQARTHTRSQALEPTTRNEPPCMGDVPMRATRMRAATVTAPPHSPSPASPNHHPARQGLKKQGISEHIRVKKKFDAMGVGAVRVLRLCVPVCACVFMCVSGHLVREPATTADLLPCSHTQAEQTSRLRDWTAGMASYDRILSGLKVCVWGGTVCVCGTVWMWVRCTAILAQPCAPACPALTVLLTVLSMQEVSAAGSKSKKGGSKGAAAEKEASGKKVRLSREGQPCTFVSWWIEQSCATHQASYSTLLGA
jgi:hypothetical protein